MPALSSAHLGHWLMQFFAALFLSILFLQSGLDKVIDWSGNYKYITGYFSKTPLARAAPLLAGVNTVMEIGAGLLSALGALELILQGHARFAFYGATLATATFLSLFFGQRLARDYTAAAGMAGYFLVGLAALFLTSR